MVTQARDVSCCCHSPSAHTWPYPLSTCHQKCRNTVFKMQNIVEKYSFLKYEKYICSCLPSANTQPYPLSSCQLRNTLAKYNWRNTVENMQFRNTVEEIQLRNTVGVAVTCPVLTRVNVPRRLVSQGFPLSTLFVAHNVSVHCSICIIANIHQTLFSPLLSSFWIPSFYDINACIMHALIIHDCTFLNTCNHI